MKKYKRKLKESRPTDLMPIMRSIVKLPFFEKLINLNYIADGLKSFIRSKDGNAYEVIIRPAAHRKFK